jgi:hypothetical protein
MAQRIIRFLEVPYSYEKRIAIDIKAEKTSCPAPAAIVAGIA